MGDTAAIALDANNKLNPHSGDSSIRIIYSGQGSQGWSGVYWQYPDTNWGNLKEGKDLSEFTKVTFWARGDKGGEKATFKVGGIDGKASYPDSIQPAVTSGVITLSKDWQKYKIDLTGQNMKHVIGGFCWVSAKDENPNGATIYLDDIQYE